MGLYNENGRLLDYISIVDAEKFSALFDKAWERADTFGLKSSIIHDMGKTVATFNKSDFGVEVN